MIMLLSIAGLAEKNGRYFMALRKPGTTIGESWEFPGGKSEEGESPRDTLVREYLEEMNVEIEVFDKVFESFFRNDSKKFRLQVFRIELKEDVREMPEHQKTGWFTPGEMIKLDMADSDRKIADFLLKSTEGFK